MDERGKEGGREGEDGLGFDGGGGEGTIASGGRGGEEVLERKQQLIA